MVMAVTMTILNARMLMARQDRGSGQYGPLNDRGGGSEDVDTASLATLDRERLRHPLGRTVPYLPSRGDPDAPFPGEAASVAGLYHTVFCVLSAWPR